MSKRKKKIKLQSEVLNKYPPDKWKKILFRIVIVLIPIVTILILEGIFRILGFGEYPEHFKEAGTLNSGSKLYVVEPAAFKPYFFRNPTRPGYTEQSIFLMPKPTNTIRIFIIGESAAKGYPQPKNLSMASFLKEMLGDVIPDKNFEVISLGTTAVSSFPLIYLVKEAVKFEPDLLIFYSGNNEFFGAYGTASINSFGSLPTWTLSFLRWTNGLAIVQWFNDLINTSSQVDKTLMEEMVDQIKIPYNDILRKASAENLKNNLSKMIEIANESKINSILCTPVGNEKGLFPLGEDDLSSLNKENLIRFNHYLKSANQKENNINESIQNLKNALDILPYHAGIHFSIGNLYTSINNKTEAGKFFRSARNFDTMPWRPTDEIENAIREVASSKNIILCDIAKIFRTKSDYDAIGWNLMDDHVHLSIKGQAEAAKSMLFSILQLGSDLGIYKSNINSLEELDVYAKRLGENIYDEYRVNHTLRVLFNIPFMYRSNQNAFVRYNSAVVEAEKNMSAEVLKEVRIWQTEKPHAGALRPITGMVAKALVRENRLDEAIELFKIAQKQIPEYSSWYLEYVYFYLAIKEKLTSELTISDKEFALETINKGIFLLKSGFSESGFTERFIGRLYQLRQEWKEAIPFLMMARPKLKNEDLVACDHALINSYLKTGNSNKALNIIENGIEKGDKYSRVYIEIKNSIKNL